MGDENVSCILYSPSVDCPSIIILYKIHSYFFIVVSSRHVFVAFTHQQRLK